MPVDDHDHDDAWQVSQSRRQATTETTTTTTIHQQSIHRSLTLSLEVDCEHLVKDTCAWKSSVRLWTGWHEERARDSDHRIHDDARQCPVEMVEDW